MPLPVIANVIRTAVVGRAVNGHAWANILHFRKDGALSYPAAIAILDPLLLSQYTTNNGTGVCWKQCAPTSAHLDHFSYTPLDGSSATSVITHSDAGAIVSNDMPASVALVVTLRTALRGRSHRGRVYLGPWTEADNGAGAPNTLVPGTVATQWTRFVTLALPGSGLSLVVASYLLLTATDVNAVSVDGVWDNQRRRNRP
jgi:hypothetical protein